jgi:predicted homoserine dehydrogenase-like protein
MILVDTALQAREAGGTPIRVAIVGAGFMSQGLANQIAHSVPGMRLVAISNRNIKRAIDVFQYCGYENVVVAETQSRLLSLALTLFWRHSSTEKTSS